jgi:tetratricopeptide (TPR) repeat protein
LLAAAVIIAAVTAAYSNSFHGPFVFDDLISIVDNPSIRTFSGALSPPQATSVARRPVTNLTLALNYAAGGLDVRGYHLVNLLIHLLAALTLFGLVRRTLLSPALRERCARAATLPAMAAALLWALHPLQTESVTYVVQRAESLMGLFFLLTLYCAARGAFAQRAWPWNAACVLFCALGVATKEVAALAPILVVLYDRAFIPGPRRDVLRRRLPLYLGLAATWGLFALLIALYPTGGSTGCGFTLQYITPWEYARSQPGVILHYLRLSVWPAPLCFDYAWPTAQRIGQILPPALLLTALFAATLWALRRRPALGLIGASFFLVLAPTSSIMPIADLAVEHRMYLALAPVVLAALIAAYALGAAFAAGDPARLRRLGLAVTLAALALAALLGAATYERNRIYRTEFALWDDVVRKRPMNPRGYVYRGAALFNLGRYDAALRDYDRAIEINPRDFDARVNRGVVCERLGRYSDAVAEFTCALTIRPDNVTALVNRGLAFVKLDRPADACRDFDRAIPLAPDRAESYFGRASAHTAARRYDAAIKDLDRAIALKPEYPEAWCNRGVAHAYAGRARDAVADYTRALAQRPAYADALNNRAVSHYDLKEYPQALADVAALQTLGVQPHPEFIRLLTKAAAEGGRSGAGK